MSLSSLKAGGPFGRLGWLRAALHAFLHPVASDTRQALAHAWRRVPVKYRTPRQFLGRQYAGCGATIGAMPRCDFACRNCYLGNDANRTPALPLVELEAQLRQIRDWLGEGGNLQLTDGEVALRSDEELLHLVRYACSLGLVPMLMTHGDGFRRRPELLPRLMVEGGLTEVSIHVDMTQRGRRGKAYRYAASEGELMPLRDEFADLIRRARRETGRTLHVATTMTVTRENLDEVPDLMRWLLRNADAFKMISFQPVAQVGRTEVVSGGGVASEELWQRISQGVSDARQEDTPLDLHKGWLGHPDCSHFVQTIVRIGPDAEPVLFPLFDPREEADQRALRGLLERIGGVTLRLDSRRRAAVRVLGLLIRYPGFWLLQGLPLVLRWWRRVAPAGRLRFLIDLWCGRQRLHYLNLVSHHFMSADELQTQRGQERLDLCVFQVSINGELRSMCEVNALGLRDALYASLRQKPPSWGEAGISLELANE